MRLSRFLVGLAFVATGARAQIPDRRDVIQEARRHIGKRYVWDTCGPDTFDCSGFVYYVLRTSLGSARFPLAYDLRQIGGGYTAQSVYYRDYLAKAGARIACGLARSADVIFFPKPSAGGVNHIGFITDPRARKFLTAQNKATGVREESYAAGSKWGARAAECYRNIWLP